MSNTITEGAGRGGNPEFRNFLHYSLGSLIEVENELLLAHRLGYSQESEYSDYRNKSEIIKKMLINLIKAL
ncbi:four helix bundle protein [Algoriphagus confluentis]|uniref:four helix bundle protein n=1 Tax=Algoriphagus confluentis TaxID=1697556 RepID=UPI003B9866B4